MTPDFCSQIRLAPRVRATNLADQLKLVLFLIRHRLNRRNAELDIVVEVDGVRYKLVDLESLFIVSPRYEAYMWKYLSPKRDDVFIDVGAHIGKYSLKIARLFGARVIAIEPDPDNFRALLEGARMNKLTNLIALNVAAYDRECNLPFYVLSASTNTRGRWFVGKGWSSFRPRPGWKAIEVAARPLDKLLVDLELDRIDWIKIDVEGAEYQVLRGSRGVIEQHRPRIIAECMVRPREVLEFMSSLGYNALSISPHYYLFESEVSKVKS